MNKYIIIGICVFVIGVLAYIFIPKTNDSKKLELTYEKSAGIPFKWVYEIEDPTIVEFVENYVLKDENTGAKTGAPVYVNYVFKGLKEGITNVTFKLVSIDNDDDVMEKSVNKIKVDKDLNISLVVIK